MTNPVALEATFLLSGRHVIDTNVVVNPRLDLCVEWFVDDLLASSAEEVSLPKPL